MTQTIGTQTVIYIFLNAFGRWNCMLGDTELEGESDTLANSLRELANAIDDAANAAKREAAAARPRRL